MHKVYVYISVDICVYAAKFVRGKGLHKCVQQQGCLCFNCYLGQWISSVVFNTGTTDGLCFISRLVSGLGVVSHGAHSSVVKYL